jgi:hypothetical protein
MRFFASWWERLSMRSAGKSIAVAIVAGGLLTHLPHTISHIIGSYWG